MRNIVILLIGLSSLSFLLAAAVTLIGKCYPHMGIGGEAFSRASNNLSLIAISLTLLFMMWFKEK